MTRDEEIEILAMARTLPKRVEELGQRTHDLANKQAALTGMVEANLERLDERIEMHAIALGRVETDSKGRDTDLAHQLADLDGEVEDSKVHRIGELEKENKELKEDKTEIAKYTGRTRWAWIVQVLIVIGTGLSLEACRWGAHALHLTN